jgi:hypothetical protein
MDPNATFRALLRALELAQSSGAARASISENLRDVATLATYLADWIDDGGFLPAALTEVRS